MSPIATLSVEEAGAALGLGPVSVRQRIKTGQLQAVKVGRAYRVHVDSVNAILGASAAKPHPPTPAPPTPPTPTPPKPTWPQPGSPSWIELRMALADSSDAPWIAKHTAELLSDDKDVVANAEFQLSMFKRSRERRVQELLDSLNPVKKKEELTKGVLDDLF